MEHTPLPVSVLEKSTKNVNSLSDGPRESTIVNESSAGKDDQGSPKPIRIKHDLMHEGIDWEHVSQYEEKIDELKKKALVPLDYSIHAPIQLIPERY